MADSTPPGGRTSRPAGVDPEATSEPRPKQPLAIAEADIGLGCNAAPAFRKRKRRPEGQRFHKAGPYRYGVLGAVGKGVPLS